MACHSSLLLDLGATNIKVAILQPDGNIVAENNTPTPVFASLGGPYRTLEPAAVLAAVEQAIASILPIAGRPSRILLSGQMHGWTLTDRHNVPHTPLVTWQDRRAALPHKGIAYVERLHAALPAQVWRAVGNELRPGIPAAGIYATDLSIIDGHYRLHSLLSWVGAALTDNSEFVQHSTDAAASGMLDLITREWSEPIIALVGGNRMLLPRVSSSVEAVGIHRASGTTVFTPVGDQQASLLGAGIREGVTVFNISTGGQVARLAAKHLGDRCQTRPFFDGLLLHTRTHLPAGRALSHGVALLSRGHVDDAAWQWAERAASTPPSRTLPQAHPTFHSEGGGGWSGITEANSPEDLLRALVEAIAAAYVDGAVDSGLQETDELLFCGGVAQRFAPVRAAIQSGLGRPAKVAPDGDMALRGLAILAGAL